MSLTQNIKTWSEKQMLPRIFYYLWTAKISRWPFHSCTIFEAYLINSHFLKFNFSHFTPQVSLYFAEKRKPKIFGFKNVMERRICKIFTFVIRWIASKLSAKYYWSPRNFEKPQVPLGWPNRYKSRAPNVNFWKIFVRIGRRFAI